MRTCSRCGETETQLVDALGHNAGEVQIENSVEATCTVGAYWEEVTYCTRCGDELSRETKTTEALGHNYVGTVTAPTCLEGGYTTYVCSRCGDTYVADQVAALGHDYVATITAPTCTEQGYTTYVCSRCGDNYVSDYVDALGHAWDNGVVTLEPTEDDEGVMTYTCGRCGETRTEAIPTLAHVHTYEAVVTDPTCTARGYTTYTCTKCGDTYEANYVQALGHSWGEWAVATEPTCTVRGESERFCSRCGERDTAVIAELGHAYESAVTAPTCTDRGYTTYTCTRCGDAYVTDYVDALGHTPGEVQIENEVTATCTVGHYWEEAVYCTVCGTEISRETKTTEALGHAWGDGVVTVAPTETTEGERTFTCTRCGATYTEVIPALDHKPGDITGDNKVTTKDLLRLMKYLSGENVEVQTSALDVNGDGKINMKDLVRLLKYLAGENVEIF